MKSCVSQRISSGLFKNNVAYKLLAYKSYLIYMYRKKVTLNNPQGLICLKTQPNPTNRLSIISIPDNLTDPSLKEVTTVSHYWCFYPIWSSSHKEKLKKIGKSTKGWTVKMCRVSTKGANTITGARYSRHSYDC